MYKAVTRIAARRVIGALNDGDPRPLLALTTAETELSFPGANSFAQMFRPVAKGREAHASHRGADECRAFAERFVAEGLRLEVEDVLVNGPPWRMRLAIRAHDHTPGPDGDLYNNRAVAFLEVRWGRIRRWEDYLDTERIAAWEAAAAHA